MATKRKVSKLRDMRLDEISLVDEPAAKGARVSIWKAAKMPGMCSDCETPAVCKAAGKCKESEKMTKGDTTDLESLSTALDEAVTKMEALEAALAAKDAEIAELKKSAGGASAGSDDDVLKGLSPGARALVEKAQKQAADAQAAIEKMQDERDTEMFVAKAAGFKVLPVKPEEFGLVLKRIARGKTTAEDVIEIERVLKAADEIGGKTGILKSIGRSGGSAEGGATAEARLQAKADEIHKAEGGKISKAAAYSKATEANPELYREYLAEHRAAAKAAV